MAPTSGELAHNRLCGRGGVCRVPLSSDAAAGALCASEQPAALPIAPLRLRLEAVGPLHVPQYKGALFRGGFGQFFRDLVCVTRAPACNGCRHVESCPYSLVFETPVLPEKFSVLRKYPNAPHPFVLVPPLDPRTLIPPGTSLCVDLTLIGRGMGYLPYFIRVMEAMGASGRYGGRFRLREIVSTTDGSRVYDGVMGKILQEPPMWPGPECAGPVERLRLDFLTPLRMRTEGRYNARPDFVAVTHALLRRVHLLWSIYGGGDGDAGWMRPLLAQADGVRTEASEFQMYEWGRTSGRQKRWIEGDGVVGYVEAAGRLTELMPYFRLGEWVNVGSGTSMGLGRYGVRIQIGGTG